MPVLAQGDTGTLKIKKVVEAFLNSFRDKDIDSTMQWVSVDYSEVDKTGTNIDYAKFKSGLEGRVDTFFANLTDYRINDIQFDNLDIQDSKATIEIKWNWTAFNLDTLKEQNGTQKRQVSLVRENGYWKITQWKWFITN